MGIRFACHHCNHALHVKDFQAGKKGRCPECKGAFRIPQSDATHSIAIEADPSLDANSTEILTVPTSQVATPSPSLPNGSAPAPEGVPSGLLTETRSPASITEMVPPSYGLASMPPALANTVNAAWFVRPPSGGQFGPASSSLLMEWINEKRVTADSLVWREGLAQWRPISELVPELFGPPKAAEAAVLFPPQIPITPPISAVPGASTSAADLAKQRREKKRRQQITIVVVLSIISCILLGVLVFVLMFPFTPAPKAPDSPPPSPAPQAPTTPSV